MSNLLDYILEKHPVLELQVRVNNILFVGITSIILSFTNGTIMGQSNEGNAILFN